MQTIAVWEPKLSIERECWISMKEGSDSVNMLFSKFTAVKNPLKTRDSTYSSETGQATPTEVSCAIPVWKGLQWFSSGMESSAGCCSTLLPERTSFRPAWPGAARSATCLHPRHWDPASPVSKTELSLSKTFAHFYVKHLLRWLWDSVFWCCSCAI